MLNEGPLEEMHPRLCADPCRLTGLKRRHELNEHLVDRIKPLALGRVSVPLSRIRTNQAPRPSLCRCRVPVIFTPWRRCQELMDVMFDLAFACVNTAADDGDAATQVQQLAFKKIIFVMEDVDAASKARHHV